MTHRSMASAKTPSLALFFIKPILNELFLKQIPLSRLVGLRYRMLY